MGGAAADKLLRLEDHREAGRQDVDQSLRCQICLGPRTTGCRRRNRAGGTALGVES